MSVYDKASLVLIPSGTKTSKVYSQKPVNGDGDFTFSRSTAATRVNADGNIEKETQNLLLQSNSFDTTWTTGTATITGGQSDRDGGTDAWKLQATSTNGRIQQSISKSGVNTYSVYAKEGNASWMQLRATGITASAFFNLDLGNVGNTSSVVDASIEDVGNGWYRCSMTANGSMSDVRIYVAGVNTTAVSSGDNIYIQDAQLEQGLVARDYIETTTAAVEGGITDNVPRLDYTDSSCPALLLEPQRTNLETQSEYIAGWSNLSNVTRTANYEESPEGVDNATRLEFTANGYAYNGNSPSQVNGSTYTLSCYAKRNDSGTQNFGFFRDGSGVVDSAMALTSEWKRFEYTYTATNISRLGLAGQSGADVSVYGFQIEKDATYATSYIPTYGTSVTRNQDACLATSVSDLIGQTQGTLFLDFEFTNPNKIVVLSTIHDNANNKRLELWANENQFYGFIGGSVNISIGDTTLTNGRHKAAIAYDESGNQAFYVDGVQIGTSSTAYTIASLTSIRFNHWFGGATYKTGEGINQFLLFKTRLSNEELADLTTL